MGRDGRSVLAAAGLGAGSGLSRHGGSAACVRMGSRAARSSSAVRALLNTQKTLLLLFVTFRITRTTGRCSHYLNVKS